MNSVAEVAVQTPAAAGLATHLATAALGAGGVGGVWGLWSWLSERSKAQAGAPAAMTTSLVSFQAALNDQARALITELRCELAEMRGRVEQLESENVRCLGENRQALQRIDSLESLLRREGIDVPGRASTARA